MLRWNKAKSFNLNATQLGPAFLKFYLLQEDFTSLVLSSRPGQVNKVNLYPSFLRSVAWCGVGGFMVK